jgi:predicted N-acetyltransferase YhbS
MRVPYEIRECKPSELTTVIERLDQEFVFSKQRSVSLSKRFPNTLSVAKIKQIRVAVSDGVICGALSIRMFEWVIKRQVWHGAMVGMVWVESQHRGEGIGSKLLSSARQFLHESDVDFGILWTGAPTFYERAGWFLSDLGLFGEVAKCSTSPRIATVSCQRVVSADAAWLERLRGNSLPMRVVRNALDYWTVPIPAVDVFCFSATSDNAAEGFALVGEQDGIGYLYEMIAPPSLWRIIWSAVAERFDRLFANGQSDDPFAQWLAENRLVEWQPQHKAMWLRVSGRVDNRAISSWHIPYYDWI